MIYFPKDGYHCRIVGRFAPLPPGSFSSSIRLYLYLDPTPSTFTRAEPGSHHLTVHPQVMF